MSPSRHSSALGRYARTTLDLSAWYASWSFDSRRAILRNEQTFWRLFALMLDRAEYIFVLPHTCRQEGTWRVKRDRKRSWSLVELDAPDQLLKLSRRDWLTSTYLMTLEQITNLSPSLLMMPQCFVLWVALGDVSLKQISLAGLVIELANLAL